MREAEWVLSLIFLYSMVFLGATFALGLVAIVASEWF